MTLFREQGEETRRDESVFDSAVEWIVGGLLVFAPLAFGTTQAWSREVFVIGVAVAAIVVAAKHVSAAMTQDRDARFVWTWAYLPIAAFLTLATVQAIALPAGLIHLLSPGALQLRSDLLSDLPDTASTLRRTTVSLYPHATVSQAVLVAAVAALFAVVIDVYREPARVQRLLAVIAAVGLAVAALAAYQNLTGATTVYGQVPAAHRNSGPFMNYSHFSQFMNLSIGAAIALLLVRLTELADYYRTPAELLVAFRRPQNALLWVAAATCVLGPITIFLCMSRMGMISMLVAAIFTGGMLAWRGRGSTFRGSRPGASVRTSLLVILALLVFSALLYTGFDVVYFRLGTVGNFESTGGSRAQMLHDMLPIFRQFPLLGTGLGSYEFVFPMFDHLNIPQIATHAENEYAQLLAETGGLGLLLGGSFVGVVAAGYVRIVREPREPTAYAAFGLGFGLVAILVHSGSDFGQHDPANAALTATSAALLLNLARRNSRRHTAELPEATRSTVQSLGLWTVNFTVLAVVVAAAAAAGWFTDRARVGESFWQDAQTRAADLDVAGWRGTISAYAPVLACSAEAMTCEPADVTYRYWNDVYHWRAIAHEVDPQTGGIRLAATDLPAAARIVADLESTRLLCPTFGPPLCVAGQINFFVLNRPEAGRLEIIEAAALTPYDRTVSLVAGLLAAHDARWEVARAAFARYTLLGGSLHDYTDALLHAGHPEIPYTIARGHRDDLLYLADRMPPSDPAWTAWIARCRSDASKLLAQQAAAPDAPAAVLAELASTDQQQGKLTDAIALYQHALRDNYARTDWRLALAHCELSANKLKDAARDAHVVLQLRPQSTEAQAVVDAAER